MEKHLTSYSFIDSINNYKNFGLIKKCKFMEITLKKNEYLFIPRGWIHCVETKEKTIALNFNFLLKEIKNTNNCLLQHIEKNIPYVNKCDLIKTNYDDFLKENFPENHSPTLFVIGDNKFINIIKKPKCSKNNIEFLTFKEAFEYEKKTGKYLYKGRQTPNSIGDCDFKILSKMINFNNILNESNFEDLTFGNSTWVTLNRGVNSGLHNDHEDNIIYVLDGEKKILLGSPHCCSYLYMSKNKK